MASNAMDSIMVGCPFDQTLLTERQLLLAMMLWRNGYLLVVLSIVRMLLLLLWKMLLLLPAMLILELWLMVRMITNLRILVDRHVVLKWHCNIPWLSGSNKVPFIRVCGRSRPDKVQPLVSWFTSISLTAFTNLDSANELW